MEVIVAVVVVVEVIAAAVVVVPAVVVVAAVVAEGGRRAKVFGDEINVGSLPGGLYFVSLSDSNATWFGKFIKN